MANFPPYSNYGYLALIKETTEGTAILPTNYLRIISESITANFANQEVNTVATDRERRRESVQGQVEISGDIVFFVEPKMIGHFLTGIFGAATDQDIYGDASAYRHVFEVTDTPKTYTIDIQRGDAPWVHRYFGCYITSLQFDRQDNAIKCTASVMPRKVFQEARVTTAVNSGTTLTLDQTSGLTTSDSILVLSKETGHTTLATYTISSVDSETQLTVSTISTQLDVGDIVVIKRATVTESSYSQCNPLQFQNGMSAYTGADIDNTSEFTIEDFQATYANDVEPRYGSGPNEIDRFPYDMLVKGYTSEGQFTLYYDSEIYLDDLRSNTKFPLRYLMQDDQVVTANSAQKASSIWGATANGFKVEASTAGKAGNDINVTIVLNTSDTLAAEISGNNVIIRLADTTASKNTGTLIAAAVNALSGVDGTVEGTGVEQFTAAEVNTNLGFKSSNTNVAGADASEQAYIQFDMAHGILDTFGVNNEEDNIINQEIPIKFFKDNTCDDENRKQWSTRVFLYNDISAY